MQFSDTTGAAYECRVTVATYLQLKTELQVDLNDIGKGDLLDRLSQDVQLLVDVVWLIAKPPDGVTKDAFLAALDGETLEAAFHAVLDAIIDFFPPAKRGPLRNLMEKIRKVETIVNERAMLAVEKIQPEQILTAFDQRSLNLRASSELNLGT